MGSGLQRAFDQLCCCTNQERVSMASNPLVAKAAQDMVASQKRHSPSVRTVIMDARLTQEAGLSATGSLDSQ